MPSARLNNSFNATFSEYEMENPFAEGAFRYVARGQYVDGHRRGQAAVCKWFKTGMVFSEEFFEKDIMAVDKALEIVAQFNYAGIVDMNIMLNVPEVWTSGTLVGGRFVGGDGSRLLVEPYVQNYQKFNSNTGWKDVSAAWPKVMQALSHFSYHITDGNCVLCDLQGGIYRDFVVLTDPVVLSRNRRYGVTDLGSNGINSFFSNHVCNKYCHPSWRSPIPAPQQRVFRPVPGTTMIAPQQSRPRRTSYYV